MTELSLLVLEGTHRIGRAIAKFYASQGWSIQLAGPDLTALQREADDIAARFGVPVAALRLDVTDTAAIIAFVAHLHTPPALVISSAGDFSDASPWEQDPFAAVEVLRANFEAPALLFSLLADRMSRAGGGTLVGLCPMSGTDSVYGCARGGFGIFLSGLRRRYRGQQIRVIAATFRPREKADKTASTLYSAVKNGGNTVALPIRTWFPWARAFRLRKF